MIAMARQNVSQRLVSDHLWESPEPLIPPPPTAKNGRTGRPRVVNRVAMEGILFMIATGIAWKKLPAELAFGSGNTCWRRLRTWQEAGVWEKLHQGRASGTEPRRTAELAQSTPGLGERPSKKGGKLTGPIPTDRGKLGIKYYLLVTADALPLAVAVTGANRHDPMLVEPILDGLRPVKRRGGVVHRAGRASCTRTRPCAFRRVRRYLSRRGITARFARIGVDYRECHGQYRWVVERTIA